MHRFRKISALFLSMLVLLGSSSFTINMHFCMEQLESITFLKDAESCAMKVSCAMEGADPDGDHEKSQECCEDRTHLVEGREEFNKKGSESVSFIYFPTNSLDQAFFPPLFIDIFPFEEYSPPFLDRDIPLLKQSFLI